MSYTIKTKLTKTFIYIFLVILFLITIVPVWILLINATRSTPEIQQGVSLLPSNNLLNNWKYLTGKGANIWRGFINSALISIPATLLTVYFSMMTAYAIQVYDFAYKKILYNIIILLTIIPTQMASIIGFYKYMSMLNLLNSYIPLIIPAIAAPPMVFFASQYLESTLVKDLIESARIEGASEIGIFHRIILPIAKPGAFTMGILSFVASWNNFFTPFMLISKVEKYTLPMMVKLLRGDMYRTEYGAIYLGLAITVIPIIIVYAMFSKYIISGISLGSVKD
ncbi:binding-protein-dependent transport systems inner membrane component [Thermoanaerobacter mathranii subsp. mathranii str. A3]|jgi:multiple sugar transport system permease protein|uniref:Binding-protein-dependent transport systems inner membrane component n=3 Tax=Thermoanaerobacter TaxID=1754 RepID=D3T5Z3_THEIA|nr:MULTISPECIES: carbohydrate ABC transporter permease [Thermoanaerobacter]MDK2814996.1 cellobiose transport system permease protein [Thermoanaerobacter sp.]ADD01524.1 binding-protein-dependent transport systems inner membrane component [Thermoanaerobacter italicus Ab9]ADH60038.1 binding-protein-dependent transport systems inner membrane component [Thermoanaerobacter mathranii subsp. mathranii str. A3]MBT1280219.1 carbohydrate ABC transporter permease [Thermoanaerobacter sp. CM-CNRG TB177]MDP9